MIANRFPHFTQDATSMRSVNKHHFDIFVNIVNCWRYNSEIGIAAGYVLDGPRIESRWEARFSELIHTGLVAHPASCTRGADKSLARPGRKQATATKLGIYSTYSPRSSIQFSARCSNFCKPLRKKNSEGPSNQVFVAAVTSSSDEKWRLFNCFFSPGNRW